MSDDWSDFTRCSSGHRAPAWTCVLPVGHDGIHVYSLWSEIAAMAEAEVEALRAQVKAVRELHVAHDDCPESMRGECAGYGSCRGCGQRPYPCATIRALDGGDA